MRLYIAAPYPWRERADALRLLIEAQGDIVTSRWVYQHEDEKDPRSQENYAIKDLEDVDSAHTLVLMTGYRGDSSWTGGRHVEFGWALAREKRCWVLGPRESVFHHLPQVIQFDETSDLLGYLRNGD